MVQLRLDPVHVGAGWALALLQHPPMSAPAVPVTPHTQKRVPSASPPPHLCLKEVVKDLWCIGAAGQWVPSSFTVDVSDVLEASDTAAFTAACSMLLSP